MHGIAVSAVRKSINKDMDGNNSPVWVRELNKLEYMLWGGTAMLIVDHKIGRITKADISSLCPDISLTTIERSLAELVKEGYIQKYGKSKGTYYTRRSIKITDN